MSVIKVEDFRTPGMTDTACVGLAVAAVNAASVHWTHSLVFASKPYNIHGPLETIRGNAWLTSEGHGRRATALSFTPTADNQAMVRLSGSSNGGLSNIRISAGGTDLYRNTVGLYLYNGINTVCENFEVKFDPTKVGHNSTGIVLERYNAPGGGNQSVVLEKFGVSAAVPVFIHNGDNMSIRDFAMHTQGEISGMLHPSADGSETVAKSASFKFGDWFAPHHHTIGAGSTQGGHHLVHCDSERNTTGGLLYLQNIRVEQIVPNADDDNAIIHFRVKNLPAPSLHGYEGIEVRGCRVGAWGNQAYGYNVSGCLYPPVFSGTTLCWGQKGKCPPESQLAINDAAQGGNFYAGNIAERDAFFEAGLWKEQAVQVYRRGEYVMLRNYRGSYEDAVPGTDFHFNAVKTRLEVHLE